MSMCYLSIYLSKSVFMYMLKKFRDCGFFILKVTLANVCSAKSGIIQKEGKWEHMPFPPLIFSAFTMIFMGIQGKNEILNFFNKDIMATIEANSIFLETRHLK